MDGQLIDGIVPQYSVSPDAPREEKKNLMVACDYQLREETRN